MEGLTFDECMQHINKNPYDPSKVDLCREHCRAWEIRCWDLRFIEFTASGLPSPPPDTFVRNPLIGKDGYVDYEDYAGVFEVFNNPQTLYMKAHEFTYFEDYYERNEMRMRDSHFNF
jgi:hypothetical protein